VYSSFNAFVCHCSLGSLSVEQVAANDRVRHGGSEFPAKEFLPDVPNIFDVDPHEWMAPSA
jgi:hypothetical protein